LANFLHASVIFRAFSKSYRNSLFNFFNDGFCGVLSATFSDYSLSGTLRALLGYEFTLHFQQKFADKH
jgi:hypothetical protein